MRSFTPIHVGYVVNLQLTSMLPRNCEENLINAILRHLLTICWQISSNECWVPIVTRIVNVRNEAKRSWQTEEIQRGKCYGHHVWGDITIRMEWCHIVVEYVVAVILFSICIDAYGINYDTMNISLLKRISGNRKQNLLLLESNGKTTSHSRFSCNVCIETLDRGKRNKYTRKFFRPSHLYYNSRINLIEVANESFPLRSPEYTRLYIIIYA